MEEMGNKLNTPKTIFKFTNKYEVIKNHLPKPEASLDNWSKIIVPITARLKFAKGPAIATIIIPVLEFLILEKFTGTGFAYPNI